MITKVVIENFKKFSRAEIEMGRDSILFVGQNNGGKTTALQAISIWSFLINRWKVEKASSTASKRTGLPIARNTISAVPVNNIRMLWHNGEVQKPDSEKIKIVITVYGQNTNGVWNYGVEATFANSELLYGKPLDSTKEIPPEAANVFHLPPLSGVQTVEKKLDEAAQLQAIGEGRPGEVLRNLLLRVQNTKIDNWKELKRRARDVFQIELKDISYNPAVDPAIEVNYMPISPDGSEPKKDFEIASSGSGFLQYLLLASFMYSHEEGAILLLDEPDSHMHAFLQRNTYDWLQEIAVSTNSQLVISTHSEIFVNSTGNIEQIITFFGKQPKKLSYDKRLLNQTLKDVSPLAIINAEWTGKIFFAEGVTDLRILRAFAEVLKHPVLKKFDAPSFFFHTYRTNDITDAKKYFGALKQIVNTELKGFCLRDFLRDANRDREIPREFLVEYWKRPEIENYLIYPEVLLRFVEQRGLGGLFAQTTREPAKKYLERKLSRAVLENPLAEDIGQKGSDFLEDFFVSIDPSISKGSYWEIARVMQSSEVHADIKGMLDKLNDFLS